MGKFEQPGPDDRGCENCGRWIGEEELLFRVRLEIAAEPRIKESDLNLDDPEQARREWTDLIARMEAMSGEAVREATDAVYEEHQFNLCRECRAELHRRLKARRELL